MDNYKKYLNLREDDAISDRSLRRLRSTDEENQQVQSFADIPLGTWQCELQQQFEQVVTNEFAVSGSLSDNISDVFIEPQKCIASNTFMDSNETLYSDCSDYDGYHFMYNNIRENLTGLKRFNNIHDFIASEEFSKKITTPVDVTIGELTLMLLKFTVANNLPATAMTNLFKLINLIFVDTVLPDSQYLIDKVFNSEDDAEFHAVCHECSAYLGKFGEVNQQIQCSTCNADLNLSNPSLSNFFITIDPSTQLSNILSIHDNYYDYIVNRREHRSGIIEDIYDGKLYRDFVKSLPNEEKDCYVTFTFNTDGVPKFKCSQYSIWPTYLMVNEIPPQDRLKNIIVWGLWFNKRKPNMATFLIPFVDLMNKLRNEGIKCMIKEQNKSIKPYSLLCCVDAVARAPMQGIKQYNGKYGCNWCLHPGVFAAGCIRFALLHFIPEARDKDRTIEIMFNANSNNTLFGVKYPSPLINLTHFNIIDGFDPDYMHSCLEGVASQITENIIQSLTERQLQSMDSYLRSIAVPHQIMRLTRPLSVRNDWKAREWENFVLYYSIPLYISIRLDKTLHDYWLLFVESLYILLQDHIKVEDVDRADQMLHEFVAKTEQIFGIANMTYNIHQMLHISASVFNWGPLWSHSTFPFESANCNLLKAVKCAKGVPQQILRFIHLNHNTLVLEKNVYKEASDTVRMYCSETLNSRMKNFSQITNITYLGKGEDADDDVINTLQLSNESKTYRRIVKNGCLFTVSGMRSSRTNDSIAQIKDGRYIQIISFIVDDNELKEITLYQVVHVQPHSYGVMKSVSFIDEEVIAILTDDIRTICVHIVIENSSYLCPVPNLLHY